MAKKIAAAPDPAVSQFLLRLPDEKRKVAMELRDIMLASHKKIGETIKWGNLTFVLGKKNIAFIYTYKTVAYVNLGFMDAVNLTDPKKLFEGTGKGMRHIKIAPGDKIPSAQIKSWAKEACALHED